MFQCHSLVCFGNNAPYITSPSIEILSPGSLKEAWWAEPLWTWAVMTIAKCCCSSGSSCGGGLILRGLFPLKERWGWCHGDGMMLLGGHGRRWRGMIVVACWWSSCYRRGGWRCGGGSGWCGGIVGRWMVMRCWRMGLVLIMGSWGGYSVLCTTAATSTIAAGRRGWVFILLNESWRKLR